MKYPEVQQDITECKNIILEAKRVLLSEQLDKIANLSLSAKNYPISNWEILKEHHNDNENFNNCFLLEQEIVIDQECILKLKLNELLPATENEKNNISINNGLQKKYFRKWKNNIKPKLVKEAEGTIKINNFIANIKNQQKVPLPNTEQKKRRHSSKAKPIECFKNRNKAQNSIIDIQRAKLEEQNKIIEELKLGIIREDLLKSIENTKIDIREIFSDCSLRLLYKTPLVKAPEERQKIMVSAQKAPKFEQKMQEKAIKRKKYREVILERKKIKEEARQKLLQEAIEKKKTLEEKERKKTLKIIQEQRKQELALQKKRQEKRQQAEAKVLKAVNFFNTLLVKQCFKKLQIYIAKIKENSLLATNMFLHKEKTKIFKAWFKQIEDKYKNKYNIAQIHFNYKIMVHSIVKWKEFKLECVRSNQVAEDLYDFRLTSNTFIYWHRYVCKQIMIEDKKIKIATKYNKRRLLFKYFYQWRYLPVVIQIEKSKEETKRKWREKVWEVLPDYRSPEPI